MTTTRPVAVITAGSQSDVGRERAENQDSLLCFMPEAGNGLQPRRGWLFAVADGMGGHAAGEIASQVAIETLARHYAASDAENLAAVLQQSVAAASEAVYRRSRELGVDMMGTTLVCAAVRDDQVYIAHAGDSRAYLLRGETLQALTQDHSLVGEQVRQGLLTEDEARESDLRGIVTRALGMKPRVLADITGPLTLRADDVILLCSDGVCGYVPEDQMRYLLQTHRAAPQRAAELLVEAANAAGGFDNATAVVVHVNRIAHVALADDEETLPALPAAGPSASPDSAPSDSAAISRSDTETIAAPAATGNTGAQPAGAAQDGNDPEQTSDRLPTADSKPARQSLLGWREVIPLVILVVALLAEALLFTSAMRRNPAEPATTAAPASAGAVADTPAPPATRPAIAPAHQITLSISLAPQPPLITFTHLSPITMRAGADTPATITLTFRTNATLIEPATFDVLLDAGEPQRMARIELAPQVNFDREEQVKIEALAEADSGIAGEMNTWSLGTYGLPSRPALNLRSRLIALLALETTPPVEPGRLPVRLVIRWLGSGAIPGDFRPGVSQTQR